MRLKGKRCNRTWYLTFPFYRPKHGKEDLGPHAYTIRNPSHGFHARVHGDLSVSVRLACPYEYGSAYGGRQQQIDTHSYVKPGNFSSGQLVKDSSLLNALYLVSPASDSTRLTLPIGLWSTALALMCDIRERGIIAPGYMACHCCSCCTASARYSYSC